MEKQYWIKPYMGPFTKKEALDIAEELGAVDCFIAKVRARSIIRKEYDVYIKIKWTTN